MKKICFLCIALFPAISSFTRDDGNINNNFYFRFGASIPSWQYYDRDSRSDWQYSGSDSLYYWENSNYKTKRFGAVFEIGSIFILNKLPIAKGLRFGLNVDFFSSNFHYFSGNRGDYNDLHFFFGSKFGPSLSYSPVKWLVFDTYAKINPVWASASFIKSFDLYSNNNHTDSYIGFFDLKYSFGFNIRMDVAILGFEYNPGSLVLENAETFGGSSLDGSYLGNNKGSYRNEKSTAMPGYNFTVGFTF